MYIIFFKNVNREKGVRLIYSEEELDFLEGEFPKTSIQAEKC